MTYPLFARISVVKADDQLSLVHLGKVLVEHGCLGMTDVEVTAGLGREAGNDLAHLGTFKTESESSGDFCRTRLGRLCGSQCGQ